MRAIANAAVQQQWNTIPNGTVLSTPSEGSSFTLEAVTDGAFHIRTLGETPMAIRREAIEAALSYLIEHGHSASNPCEIRSNKVYAEAGPLCRAAREANQPGSGGTMIITYALPILKKMGLVQISDQIPTTAWPI